MGGGKLSLAHVCSLIAHAQVDGRIEAAGGAGFITESSGLYPAPNFPAFNCTNSTSNATYECADPTATYTLDGFFRRAPVEQVFAWGADQVEISETPNDAARAVVPALELGGEYKFRVAGLYHHPSPPLPPEACDAGLLCGRCLLLLRPSECPTRPDLGRSCEAARAGELCEGGGECGTDQAADNCGGFDVYVVHYLLPTTKWLQAAPTPYSVPLTVVPSGPGAPVAVHTEEVGVNSLRLAWTSPEVDSSRGLWHGSGGQPMLGYRVYSRIASRPVSP